MSEDYNLITELSVSILSLVQSEVKKAIPEEILGNHAFQSELDRAFAAGYNEARLNMHINCIKAGLLKE
jgi:hypothetical protein